MLGFLDRYVAIAAKPLVGDLIILYTYRPLITVEPKWLSFRRFLLTNSSFYDLDYSKCACVSHQLENNSGVGASTSE